LKRALVLALLCFAGCAQIIGIEDRKLDPDAGAPANDAGSNVIIDPDSGIETTPACVEYCTLAQQLCTAEAKVQLYETYPGCLSVCRKYSTDPSTTGNTLACRLNLLRSLSGAPSEATTTCQGAGPGGGPPPGEPAGASCGTDCSGFCALRAATCPQQEGDVDCERKCQALVNDELYNATVNFGSGQDTLSCRVAHLSAAALYDATETPDDAGVKKTRNAHCSHSGIRSEVQCDFPKKDPPMPPDCESYCKIVSIACTGEAAIYQSDAQCLKVCEKFSTEGEPGQNTFKGSRRCMRSGAYDALEGRPGGCQRASIAGDGCVGGRTESYCYFAKQACPELYAQTFTSDENCSTLSAAVPDAFLNAPYGINAAVALGGKSMQCRLRSLTKLLEGSETPANACPAALGLQGSLCN
jgi:hypothetical protein